eukprot:CAMPEP_0116095678 /NCGR_PEP_ID=MMETSP0327-20121206/9791_1 /TAXON_ID=44447 /ORGANISM="Pseudo-nitzschia delicatissima, Strain B596" /LENGTH=389 /DNA_ID=CAMNT_0003587361 /DNA_START=312 /DNA_END=1481 /DNA_ORIENTATION=+
MSVMDVHNLKLKDGINWLEPQGQLPQSSSTNKINRHLSTPISKCLLVGHIVYTAERKGGSKVYILDDGTGMIDCVHWSTDVEDPYHLPSLTDPLDDQDCSRGFAVGELVRMFGKIDCLSSMPRTASAKGGRNDNVQNSNDKFVVREIQIRIIERVEDYLASEAQHWIDSSRRVPVPLRAHLEKLGPGIREQIRNRVNLPSTDDGTNSWRVFGATCNCKLPYMDDLLYCHCQCTAEPIDPFYHFRDALLQTLLSMESKVTGKLEFNYKEVRNDRSLQTMASKVIASKNDGTEKQGGNAGKLFLKTFRALRCDGIIYLLNSNTDNYLLITRKRVLEPVVERHIGGNGRNFISFERTPRHISRVHHERLRYIQRLLLEEQATPSAGKSEKNC